jgi:hypothetical protein
MISAQRNDMCGLLEQSELFFFFPYATTDIFSRKSFVQSEVGTHIHAPWQKELNRYS